jgi:hypothetical protein
MARSMKRVVTRSPSAEETMSDPHGKSSLRTVDIQPSRQEQERRSQTRAEGVLAKIEDATYAILRKHEKKPA